MLQRSYRFRCFMLFAYYSFQSYNHLFVLFFKNIYSSNEWIRLGMTEQELNADLLCSDEQFQNESFVETEQQIHIVNSDMKSEDISDTNAQTSGVHNVYFIGH